MAGINRNFDSNVSHLDSHFNELQCFFDMEAGGKHLCGSLNLLNRCVYWLSLAFAYFFALPSSGLWFRSSFPKGRFFCTTRNCAA